jgi:hypothetical protein
MGLGGAEATQGAEDQLIGLLTHLHDQCCFLAPSGSDAPRAAEEWEQGPEAWASTHLGLGARALPGCGGEGGELRLALEPPRTPQLRAGGYAFTTADGQRVAHTGAGPRDLAASPGALVNGTAGSAAAELTWGQGNSAHAGLAGNRPEAGGELLYVYAGTSSDPAFSPAKWGGRAQGGSAAE